MAHKNPSDALSGSGPRSIRAPHRVQSAERHRRGRQRGGVGDVRAVGNGGAVPALTFGHPFADNNHAWLFMFDRGRARCRGQGSRRRRPDRCTRCAHRFLAHTVRRGAGPDQGPARLERAGHQAFCRRRLRRPERHRVRVPHWDRERCRLLARIVRFHRDPRQRQHRPADPVWERELTVYLIPRTSPCGSA